MRKNSIAEYAKSHPMPEALADPKPAEGKSYSDRQEERQQAIDLKESITRQIQEGRNPENILYTAIRAIGLLTNDNEWTEQNTAALDKVYEDLGQQSFIVDNAEIAARRLDKMQKDYQTKLRRQVMTQLNGYKRIQSGLSDIVRALDSIEDQTEQIAP